MYSVNFYGSHPDLNNDDCWTGVDFELQSDARKFYSNPWQDAKFAQYFKAGTAYIELDGPDINIHYPNPGYKPARKNEYREDAHDLSRLDNHMPYGYGEENR